MQGTPLLGRGRPHQVGVKLCSSLPPTMASLLKVRQTVVYFASLEFALGNLDDLKLEVCDPKQNRRV